MTRTPCVWAPLTLFTNYVILVKRLILLETEFPWSGKESDRIVTSRDVVQNKWANPCKVLISLPAKYDCFVPSSCSMLYPNYFVLSDPHSCDIDVIIPICILKNWVRLGNKVPVAKMMHSIKWWNQEKEFTIWWKKERSKEMTRVQYDKGYSTDKHKLLHKERERAL